MYTYKLPCGCTPDASGYGYCGECVRKLRTKIWHGLTDSQKNYDRRFGGAQIDEIEDDYNSMRESECCSCHITAPCRFCERQNEYEDE